MKTAEQWQADLNLEALPDGDLLTLLNEAASLDAAVFTAEEVQAAGSASPLTLSGFEEELEALHTAQTIGAALAAARAARGQSLQEVGDKLGVTRARVQHVERGENAELATVARFAAALGYRAVLTLEPDNDSAPTIRLQLTAL